MEPLVPEIVVIEGTVTRMPSYGVSWYSPPDGVSIVFVSVIGAGRAFPVLTRVTVGELLISVAGVWLALAAGKVATVPVTLTTLPIAAAAGGAELVKTSMPSGVRGSLSGDCDWMKKPFDRTAVTIPLVVTFCPT
jgi:hypothetical protein